MLAQTAQLEAVSTTTRHALLGGKVQVFRRANSPHWQCSASVGGRQFRSTTKQDSLALAKDFAEDWYLTLQGKHRFGGGIAPKRSGKTFREAGEQFVLEYEAITLGERNAEYVRGHSDRLSVSALISVVLSSSPPTASKLRAIATSADQSAEEREASAACNA